ncbi:hypothetical protein VTN00DRAFT_4620 [Thermoascus crustaceus]|uniref:uncharacterized protein n=1 Tax=Thermoascus crustaceus TaxID=5088 RepID=UPI00374277C1
MLNFSVVIIAMRVLRLLMNGLRASRKLGLLLTGTAVTHASASSHFPPARHQGNSRPRIIEQIPAAAAAPTRKRSTGTTKNKKTKDNNNIIINKSSSSSSSIAKANTSKRVAKPGAAAAGRSKAKTAVASVGVKEKKKIESAVGDVVERAEEGVKVTAKRAAGGANGSGGKGNKDGR